MNFGYGFCVQTDTLVRPSDVVQQEYNFIDWKEKQAQKKRVLYTFFSQCKIVSERFDRSNDSNTNALGKAVVSTMHMDYSPPPL